MTEALQLFLTLAGVTLLFGCAQANGAMEGAARQALRLCSSRTFLLPPFYFCMAAAFAMVGPGAILATALVAPFAMSTGVRAGLPPLLIALMVANGANAGNLSPFSTVGAIVNGLMTGAGISGYALRVWFFHALAHLLAATCAWLLFGRGTLTPHPQHRQEVEAPRMEPRHVLTLLATAAWILAVVLFGLPLGYSAITAALLLFAVRAAAPREAVARMPWKTIFLVVGISTAVGLVGRLGGLDWFQDFVARISTPHSVHAVLAALTGLISAYSSTSGVVLPAFLPQVPGIAARLPGVDAVSLAITINIGSALVDVSPLSTIGALCVAAAPAEAGGQRLYRGLLLWGFLMIPAAALFCYSLASWFRP